MLKLLSLCALLGALFSPTKTAPLPGDVPAVELTASTTNATSGTISGTVTNPVQLDVQLDAPGCPPLGNFTLILLPGSTYGQIVGFGTSYLGLPTVVRGYYRFQNGAGHAIVAAGYGPPPFAVYHSMEIRWTSAGFLDGGWRERP